jgi:hypothetical protein
MADYIDIVIGSSNCLNGTHSLSLIAKAYWLRLDKHYVVLNKKDGETKLYYINPDPDPDPLYDIFRLYSADGDDVDSDDSDGADADPFCTDGADAANIDYFKIPYGYCLGNPVNKSLLNIYFNELNREDLTFIKVVKDLGLQANNPFHVKRVKTGYQIGYSCGREFVTYDSEEASKRGDKYADY